MSKDWDPTFNAESERLNDVAERLGLPNRVAVIGGISAGEFSSMAIAILAELSKRATCKAS